MIVAIDGPAGAGKSTVAKALAHRLGFRYVDSGATYRALAWRALEDRVALDDAEALAELARSSVIALADERVLVDGRDVTEAVREARIDRVVSAVAAHSAVRSVLRAVQRELASDGDAVVEGRDIGTVVCPDAEVKVYLTADPRERARRRGAERPADDQDELAAELHRRDAHDAPQSGRAPDAIVVDTTGLPVEAVVEQIERLVTARASR